MLFLRGGQKIINSSADWKIIHTLYKGMTREEIVAKINDYIYHNGIVKMVEPPKVEPPKVEEPKKPLEMVEV